MRIYVFNIDHRHELKTIADRQVLQQPEFNYTYDPKVHSIVEHDADENEQLELDLLPCDPHYIPQAKRFQAKYPPPPQQTFVTIDGKSEDGQQVFARVPYEPFCFYQTPDDWNDGNDRVLIQALSTKAGCLDGKQLGFEVVHKSHVAEWKPDRQDARKTRQFRMLKVRFPSMEAMLGASRYFNYQIQVWKRYRENPRQNPYLRPDAPVDPYAPAARSSWRYQVPRFFARGLPEDFLVSEHEKISCVHKFIDDCSILPESWIDIDDKHLEAATEFASSNAQEFIVHQFQHIHPSANQEDTPKIKVISFDLECPSKTFPKSHRDPISHIGNSIQTLGSKEPFRRHVFCFKEAVCPDPGVQIHWYPTEKEMLMAWRDFLVAEDPDVLTGYNIDGFDSHYIFTRMEYLWPEDSLERKRFQTMNRIWADALEMETCDMRSNAIAKKVRHLLRMPGRIVMDLLEVIRREHKLRGYSLNEVATEFVKRQKEDLDPKDIYKNFHLGPLDRGIVAKYCATDCDLVLELMEKLSKLTNILGMARVTRTFPEELMTRGQQIKVLNQLLWKAHRRGYVLNKVPDIEVEGKYKGATVLTSHPGYYRRPVATLDFASLYPSIMIANNLCPSTWVRDPQYADLPGAEYKVHNVGDRKHCFVTHVRGIVPDILEELLSERAKVRKMMKTEQDAFRVSMLDGLQLAYKVSANSVYGFFGTKGKGMYPCLPVSESTTAIGRRQIEELQQDIERKYPGTKVIYGDTDSVFVAFNLTGLSDEEARLKAFDLGDRVCERANTLFPGCSLTMEKVFDGLLMVSKKRYVGYIYEGRDKKPKIKESGVDTVRRDKCLFVGNLCRDMFDAVFIHKDVKLARQKLIDKFQQLVDDKVPFEEFVLTCGVKESSDYQNQRQFQIAVVNKMKNRLEGSEPVAGDRMAYVLLNSQVPIKQVSKYDIVEDAKHAKEKRLPLHRLYYFDRYVCKSLDGLFAVLIPDLEEIMRQTSVELERQQQHQQDIGQWIQTESVDAKSQLIILPASRLTLSATTPAVKPSGLSGIRPDQPKFRLPPLNAPSIHKPVFAETRPLETNSIGVEGFVAASEKQPTTAARKRPRDQVDPRARQLNFAAPNPASLSTPPKLLFPFKSSHSK